MIKYWIIILAFSILALETSSEENIPIVTITESDYLWTYNQPDGNIRVLVGDVIDSLEQASSAWDNLYFWTVNRPDGNFAIRLGDIRDVNGNGIAGLYLMTYGNPDGEGRFLVDDLEGLIPTGPQTKEMVGGFASYVYTGNSSNNGDVGNINVDGVIPSTIENLFAATYNSSTGRLTSVSTGSTGWKFLGNTDLRIGDGDDGYLEGRLVTGVNVYVGLGYSEDLPFTGTGNMPYRVYIVGWSNCRIFAPDISGYKSVISTTGFRTARIERVGSDVLFYIDGTLRHTSVGTVEIE